jgi:hypothetical protein
MPRRLIINNRYYINGRLLEGFLFSDRTYLIRYQYIRDLVNDTIDEALIDLPPKGLPKASYPLLNDCCKYRAGIARPSKRWPQLPGVPAS